ncbi:hypothetical protein EMA8858_00334 [Emticicia aquatica]|uniref:Uncharacterized protein n=1 Tax=Emticicia aquatica TaxID=1681835 RepID=A0ABN8EMY6_9BACT|nr:hypothetical protein [Emticicia aquatica]CAH0994225.1 hypothetical protein EMA8858_00334 [Emticicia aquatica]
MKKTILLLVFVLIAQNLVLGQKITKNVLKEYGTYNRGLMPPKINSLEPEASQATEVIRLDSEGRRIIENAVRPTVEIDPLLSITRPSFKKIFKSDFSSVIGINDLPVNQIVVGVNKPEIKIGNQLLLYKDSSKSLPWGGLFPYVKGKQNEDGEYKIFSKGKFDPTINYGVQIILFPLNFRNNPFYKFTDYRKAKAVKASSELLLSKVSNEVSGKEIGNKIKKLDSIISNCDSLLLHDTNLTRLKRNLLEVQIDSAYNKLDELKDILKDPIAYVEKAMYEKEKEIVFDQKRFFWLALDLNTERIKTNLFQNQKIIEDEIFNKNVFGLSVNHSIFKKNSVFNAFIKLDFSRKNAFLSDKKVNFVRDSLISNSSYVAEKESIEAYDTSVPNFDRDKKGTEKILKLSATYLWGKEKKQGITIFNENNLGTKISNLKLGYIIPVILDNDKAEQSNIILEWALPDLGTFKGLFDRSYVNIKVGIPINIL